MKTEARIPLSVDGPGGICKIVGCSESRFLMIEMEMGEMPELAVTAIVPSVLNVNPKGWGATSIDLPYGLIIRPFGRMVLPALSIFVYKLPEGEDTTFNF
jgi:hypothetical protein